MLLLVLLILSSPTFSLIPGTTAQSLTALGAGSTATEEKISDAIRGETEAESSDPRTPTVKVDGIDFSGMTVSWVVNETSRRPSCTFEIEACHPPVGCHEVLKGIPWDQRIAVVPFQPLVKYSLTVTTRCATLARESTFPSLTQSVFTAFAPSKITNVSVTANPTSLEISLQPPGNESQYIRGYTFRLSDQPPREHFEDRDSLDKTQVFENLEPATNYTVIFAAFTEFEDGTKVVGIFNEIAAKTLELRPPERIRSEVFSSHGVGLSWDSPDFEPSMYRVRCLTQMQVCFRTTFSKDASVELRDLQASSSYTVDVSACVDEERCGPAAKHHFSTPPGRPSAPRSLKALRSEHSMLITWEPPEHFEGFLDGYVLGFCLKNEEHCPLNDEWEHVERMETSVTRPGHDEVSKVVLKAFNNVGAKTHYSDAATADVENDGRTSRLPVLFIIGCVVMSGVVFVGMCLQYRKKRFDRRDRIVLVTANLSGEHAEIRMS